jgi:hypothetical protein
MNFDSDCYRNKKEAAHIDKTASLFDKNVRIRLLLLSWDRSDGF